MSATRTGKIAYYALLAAALVALFFWQSDLRRHARDMHIPDYSVGASIGLCADFAEFYLFYHYTGEFPVAPSLDHPWPAPTPQAIAAYIRNHGKWLVMDYAAACNNVRCGDCGKLFLYFLDDITPDRRPTVGRFNRWLFISSLGAILVSFWMLRRPVLGILLVVLIGSDPFQLIEVYLVDNIFSLPISLMLWMLALHAPLLFGKARTWYVLALAAASGIILATFREIRSEPAMVAGALPIAYLFWPGATALKRVVPCLLLAATFFLTGKAWGIYWDRKFADAAQFVSDHGGVPYPGLRSQHHVIWHSVYCGLGDFGMDKGYVWDDRKAYAYAVPILNSKYGFPVTYTKGAYYFDQSYDPGGIYPVKPEDLPIYNEILRDKILSDIRNDPRWYAKILLNRAWLCLTKSTPISLAWDAHFLSFPGIVFGPGAPAILLLALLLRRFGEAKLMLMTLPLLGTSILIYSRLGTTYYGIFHLAALAILLEAVVICIANKFIAKFRPAANPATEVNP
jgi:hypothetical protein